MVFHVLSTKRIPYKVYIKLKVKSTAVSDCGRVSCADERVYVLSVSSDQGHDLGGYVKY